MHVSFKMIQSARIIKIVKPAKINKTESICYSSNHPHFKLCNNWNYPKSSSIAMYILAHLVHVVNHNRANIATVQEKRSNLLIAPVCLNNYSINRHCICCQINLLTFKNVSRTSLQHIIEQRFFLTISVVHKFQRWVIFYE